MDEMNKKNPQYITVGFGFIDLVHNTPQMFHLRKGTENMTLYICHRMGEIMTDHTRIQTWDP